MAVAFQAVLDGPNGFTKPVLIKILHPEHVNSSHYYGMFVDEARLCSRLQHANIPQTYELGEQDDLPFMVMEFVDGPNLVLLHRQFRDGKKREWGHIASIFAGVARALSYAHNLRDVDGRPMNIIHRDVSLANVMVGRDGVAKLIDFGIAKWDQSESVTEMDVLKGKLRYMAPEQLQRKDLDGRVDIYQLGVAMYWLTTGKPPFGNANAAQEMLARLETLPPPLTTVIHGFPPRFEQIIMRCLEPDVSRRYETAARLADDLEGFIRSAPVHHSSTETVAEWIRELFPGRELELYLSPGAAGTAAGVMD
jgi:serine/threonine-protein kinase